MTRNSLFYFITTVVVGVVGVAVAAPFTPTPQKFKTINQLDHKYRLALLDSPPKFTLPKNPPFSQTLPTYQQDRRGNPYSGYYSPSYRQRSSPLLNLPNSKLKTSVEIDTKNKTYNISEQVGGMPYRPSLSMPILQYQRSRADSAARKFWLGKDIAKDVTGGGQSNRLIPIYKLPPFAARVFGGENIDIKPMGQVLLDLGGRWQSIDNPQIPVQQQTNGGLFFDQQIRLSLAGKIGERVNINVNWDTKSTFQFENQFKIGYQIPTDDVGIIRELNVGNVSMQSSNSLIAAGQNLLGIQTRLQFGKLFLNAVASNTRGSQEVMVLKGGGQQREFEIRADNYEFNRHFFLSDFFRNNYEKALETMPMITGGVIVTRVEVYVTNRVNNTQTLRNLAAFLDLGSTAPFKKNNGLIGTGGRQPVTDNTANDLYKNIENDPNIRNIDNVSNTLLAAGLEKGTDFDILRAARKLSPNEFLFNPQLGFITLLSPIRNDEVLAVAYEYTYNGQRYTVGELSEKYQSLGTTDAIILKMLKPSTLRTDLPTWDLMMKNIYTLNNNQIVRDNFQFRVIYRDDATGIDNPNLQEGENLRDVPLVRVFNMDRLNQNNDPQPDGNFDYVKDITVLEQYGRIIFPVLEPFGRTLRSKFNEATEKQLIDRYVFDELYRKTQMDAQLLTSKSKFFLKGSFQAGVGGEIRLPGINISPKSVQVQAGGITLLEGTDYTVDYQMGLVRITNQSVMASGKEIRIQYERADLFNFQQRYLVGLDAQYLLSKNTRFTGTFMNLNERPVITRVNIGAEPTDNTLIGFGVHHAEDDARLLTKWVDKLPLYSTKEKSAFKISSEVAALLPGTPGMVSRDGGTAYVDDFEAAEIPYDLGRQPITWQLGSTPQQFVPIDVIGSNPLAYSYKRAKLAWYMIDNTAFYQNTAGASPPSNLTLEDGKNHYVRVIPYNEIINPDALQINQPEFVMNMAYYPNERGQYNYNTDINQDGTLKSPKNNFGSITKGITSDVDFDNINIQYIEFWMLDPFIGGERGTVSTTLPSGEFVKTNNTTGGTLYFNLGNISEDVVPDGRHGFENGLPTTDDITGRVKETPWGRVTEQQFLTNAFAVGDGARAKQDIGLDGLNDEQERQLFANYLRTIESRVTPTVQQRIFNDPSADNFKYYLGGDADASDLKILDRYKFYNGMENNSPENAGTASYTTFPDNEDLNRDNSLNDLESYYEYKVDLKPNQVTQNPYVVDRVQRDVNGDKVNWYLFRIPIREYLRKVGGIDNFKSIRYIRMYMTDWEQPVVLRMAHFKFVGTPWRPFTEDLKYAGLNLPAEPSRTQFNVSSVSVINNGRTAANQANAIPYDLPPGFVRDINLVSNTQARLDEKSLRMCIENLGERDARAVYKNVVLDMVNYKRVKLFLHAESQNTRDDEVTAFLRLGTDFKENYYEIEVPLKMTPYGKGSYSPEELWPKENEIDFPLEELINIKARRNIGRLSVRVPYQEIFEKYKVTVVGNPDLSSVQTLMIGVRNPESPDGQDKSVCIWANELRVAEFNTRSGWATRTTANLKLADLAVVNGAFRYVSPFFGGIQDKLSQRTRNHTMSYDINMAIQLDKFGLNKLGFRLPLFVGIERTLLTPYFNPLDPDTPLSTSLLSKDNPDDYSSLVREDLIRRTVNLTNVGKTRMNQQKKPMPWDVENLTFNLAWQQLTRSDIRTAEYLQENTRVGIAYTYAPQVQPIEPFKEWKQLDYKYLKFVKDFNITPLPNNVTVRGDFERRFVKTQLRNAQLTTLGVFPLFEKAFTFNRNYQLGWAISKNLRLDYTATAMAIIDEPEGEINSDKAGRFSNRSKRDSVWYNLLNLGRMKNYSQQTSLTYKLPLDKFPAIDWLASDVKYTAGYSWTAGAVGLADSLGNQSLNNRSINVTAQGDFKKLYSKSRFFQMIENPQQVQQMPSKYENKKRRLQAREQRLLTRKEKLQEKYEALKIQAQLDSAMISEGKKAKLDRKNARLDAKIEKVRAKLAEVQAKEQADQAPATPPAKPVQLIVKSTIMALQKVNVSYTETNNTDLPSMLAIPNGAFGMNSAFNQPGWGFVFGSQDPSIRETAAREGWLGRSAALNNPFRQGYNRTLQIQATLEPVKDFQIQLQAKRTDVATYQEIFSYDRSADRFTSKTPSRMGQYGISFLSIATAFSGDNAINNSAVFDEFIRNRSLVKGQLDGQNPQGQYDLNAQDVLIPSFVAAYAGKDVRSMNKSPFIDIPLPNWRATYNLSNIPFFKANFRSFQLEHAYTSEYTTGAYTSSLAFTNPALLQLNIDLQNLPLAQLDDKTGKLSPVFVMNQIQITEAFAPLVGVNFRTKNNWSVKLRYAQNRGIALNLSNAQVTELKNADITVDIGFTKANLKLPFKMNGKIITLKNDLTFACAVTIRDTKTAQRSIKTINNVDTQESIVTQGNLNFQIRPTLNYVVNQRISLQAYFDHTLNSPYVSNSFRRTTTAFGIQLRFNLQ